MELKLKPFKGGTLIGGYRLVNRFNQDNSQIYGEYYRRLVRRVWGYVSGDLSPNPSFLPTFSAGGGIFRTFKKFELGTSFRFMKFQNSEVYLLIPTFTYYLPRNFFYSANLFISLRRGTYTLLNRLSYRGRKLQAYVSLSAGTSSERIEAREDFIRYRTNSFSVGGEYRLRKRFSVGGSFKHEYRESLYIRRGVEIYGKHWW